MKRSDINATTYLAMGAGVLCGAVCGFLLGKHLAEKAANERIEAETTALRQHYGTRLAEANARAKGNNPGDWSSTVGADPGSGRDPESWLKDKLAPVAEEEIERGSLRRGAGSGFPYGAASEAARSAPLPSQRTPLPVVARRNTLDDAAADGRLDEAGDSGPVPGDAGGVPDQPGPDSPGRRDPMEGVPRDPEEDDPDDPDDRAPGIGPVLKDTRRIVILSQDEFLANEFEDEGYTQLELTYFEGDQVLVDERDVPVRSPEMIAGHFKQYFGHNTTDPDIVYVRNNAMKLDIEIKRRYTEYRTEVLGYGVPE